MPASQESPGGTAPSVLLVEEYGALAAALTSALKKFAPRHQTRVVESLGEAELAAAEAHPQLFVLDFDPPHPNAIDFFNRMSIAHPDARALVIASGTSPEFTAQRYGPNAVQFVEKPFELADFGAAVQALLGPWTETSSGDSRGTLRDLNPRDFVPLECVSGATAVLRVTTREKAGEIHFFDGHICHASAPGLSGIEALHEIMGWKDARGIEMARVADGPRTIPGPWVHVFLEALQTARPRIDELKTPAPLVSSLEPPRSAEMGKKIVVIDDTEMLLIFVEDSLAIADPSLQITTALTGSDGIKQTEEIIPDLVLLDFSLSDLRGDQVCERLLQNKATARIPVVMMSGHVPEMMATAERCSNVVATIAKPFMSDALVQLVNDKLAEGRLPSPPPGETRAVRTEIPAPAGAARPEAKPLRLGNGKKPAWKSAPSKSATENVPERPSAPAVAGIKVHPKVAASASSQSLAAREILAPEPALLERSHLRSRPTKLATSNRGSVVLGWGMEVISVQFTPRFQIGTIRVRPSATLSLTRMQLPSTAENRTGAGFELGSVELDSDGQIRTMRVRPTRSPAHSIHTRNGFAINDVTLVNGAACIQFTAGSVLPMIMRLVAPFNVARVELSERFEVAQLVLQPEGTRVRIILDSQLRGVPGAEFETVGVRLDASARIVEFALNPAAI